MTATATLDADDSQAIRDRLRDAIAKVNAEQERLASLEDAQSRAHQQLWHAESKLSDAKRALQRAQADERSRLAYAYVANNSALQDDPRCRRTSRRQRRTRRGRATGKGRISIGREVDRVKFTLRQLHANRDMAMSELVCTSTEYQLFIQQHATALRQLPTVKTALKAVSAGLRGQLPQRFMDEPQRSEPLEERVGYPVDATFVGAWADALAQLEQDAYAELPLFG
jgi:hypothetical protein